MITTLAVHALLTLSAANALAQAPAAGASTSVTVQAVGGAVPSVVPVQTAVAVASSVPVQTAVAVPSSVPVQAVASTEGIPRQQLADTVIRVSRGARLEVGGRMTSDIRITTWDRDEVNVVGPTTVRVSGTNGLVRLDAATGRGGRGRGGNNDDYAVTVPRWMPITIQNARGDVTIEGSEAEVDVDSQSGTVRVVGGRGRVTARSTTGSVYIENVQGSVTAYTVNQSMRLIGVTGDIRAESTNGNITLDQVDTRSLQASSTNGNIDFGGPIRDDGVYRLTTHNGRVSMAIAENANATISISTFNGRYSASFPIQVTRMGPDRRFTFVVGSGSARIEASSFNGNIAFLRPGQPRPAA